MLDYLTPAARTATARRVRPAPLRTAEDLVPLGSADLYLSPLVVVHCYCARSRHRFSLPSCSTQPRRRSRYAHQLPGGNCWQPYRQAACWQHTAANVLPAAVPSVSNNSKSSGSVICTSARVLSHHALFCQQGAKPPPHSLLSSDLSESTTPVRSMGKVTRDDPRLLPCSTPVRNLRRKRPIPGHARFRCPCFCCWASWSNAASGHTKN